jgi:hypothetical protein
MTAHSHGELQSKVAGLYLVYGPQVSPLSEMMRSFMCCRPHVIKMPTLTYNRANIFDLDGIVDPVVSVFQYTRNL